MGLSFYEQETVIRYNRQDELMEIYTAYPPLMRKLSESGEYTKVREDKAGGEVIAATFTASKKMLTLRTKRPAKKVLTAEEKKIIADRLKKARSE